MLEIRDLHVKFHTRQREAVAGVSLTIHDGEILGLVGESGSGKSVTAMSVAGLLPRKQCDFSGEILLDGAELLHADRTLLRQVQGREIGVVFQEPHELHGPPDAYRPPGGGGAAYPHQTSPGRRGGTRPWRPWQQWSCRTRRACIGSIPTSSPAGCCSGP